MIEIIRTLIESLANGFPGLREMRQNKQRSKLGAELFVLYTTLNSLFLTGAEIVELLEKFAADTQPLESRSSDDYDRAYELQLKNLVRQQKKAITDVREAFDRRSTVLQIIEPDAYNRLIPLLGLKEGALSSLHMILMREHLALGPSQEDLDRWSLLNSERMNSIRSTRNPLLDGLSGGQIADRHFDWQGSAIPLTPWGPEVHPRIVQYLDTRRPAAQLDEARSALALLRTSLTEHFTLEDILLEFSRKPPRH
ncbi:hypothetical protein [Streptomyces griseoflavus]|uniref:hypothetical protein n=1 Tax=Streptomyces griseoflavus TaxID=35619 RepID=UPI00131A447A|nr:hypothetical protein [Streptomyces griseoflavus]